jgi:FtsZ-binding cell division protein ZapB
MWQSIVAWARLLWNTGKEVVELQAEVESLLEKDRELYQYVQMLAIDNENLRRELQHEREKRADEIEKIELRLRLQISEELRRLPPS